MEKTYDLEARRKWPVSSLALMPRQSDIETDQPHDYEDADRNVMRHRTKAAPSRSQYGLDPRSVQGVSTPNSESPSGNRIAMTLVPMKSATGSVFWVSRGSIRTNPTRDSSTFVPMTEPFVRISAESRAAQLPKRSAAILIQLLPCVGPMISVHDERGLRGGRSAHGGIE